MRTRTRVFALLIACLICVLSGCQTTIPTDFLSDSDSADTPTPVTDCDYVESLTWRYNEYFSASDAIVFYEDGYTFVGTSLCIKIRCEDCGKTRLLAIGADFPYSFGGEDGIWFERVYDDGGGEGYNVPVEPMPSYSDFSASNDENVHYNTLSDEDKAIYDEMYDKLRNFELIRYTTDDMSEEDIYYRYNIYMSITDDHPVLRSYVTPKDNCIDYKLISSEYVYHVPGSDTDLSIDNVKATLAKYDEICDEIVSSMPEGLSTYAKYLYLAQRLCAMTEYDYEQRGSSIGGPCAPILLGKGVCQEYSEAYCELCRRAGLFCTTVSGTVNGEMHGWNLIKLEEGTYHVDLTWADSGDCGDATFMSYFALTQDEILYDHDEIIDGTVATGVTSLR